jgi:hypothetical protein
MELQQYDFNIKHRLGKVNANADALSRLPEVHYIDCFMMEITIQSAQEITVRIPEQTPVQEKVEDPQEYEADSEDNNSSDNCGGWVKQSKKRVRFTETNEESDSSTNSSTSSSEDQEQIPRFIDTWPNLREEYYPNWGESEMTIFQQEELSDDLTEPSYEDDIEELFSLYTVAWEYCQGELEDIYKENIKEKWVIANQPITHGGSRCTFSCDTENHHLHTYCKACQRNLLSGTVIHNCNVGLLLGQVHPDMNAIYLVNNPWWDEPQEVACETQYYQSLYASVFPLSYYEDVTTLY